MTGRASSLSRFGTLLRSLMTATLNDVKVRQILDFLSDISEEERYWTVRLLMGWRSPRKISSDRLRDLVIRYSEYPEWLFDESLKVTRDKIETSLLIIPPGIGSGWTLAQAVEYISTFQKKEDETQAASLFTLWEQTDRQERFVIMKWLLGGIKGHDIHNAIIKAVARLYQRSVYDVAPSLYSAWLPHASLKAQLALEMDATKKYHPVEIQWPLWTDSMEDAGDGSIGILLPEGIDAQLILADGESHLWSMDDRYLSPFCSSIQMSSDLDITLLGTLALLNEDEISPEEEVERSLRIGNSRKTGSKALIFIVYDLLHMEGKDLDKKTNVEKVGLLKAVFRDNPSTNVFLAEEIEMNVDTLSEAFVKCQAFHYRGVLTKSVESKLQESTWALLKPERKTINAVLLYVKRDQFSPTSDSLRLTLGIWKGNELVPVVEVESDLNENEEKELAQFIRENTTERFGPVRSLIPSEIFSVSYDSVISAPRKKSGIALRNPELKQWERNLRLESVSRLTDLITPL